MWTVSCPDPDTTRRLGAALARAAAGATVVALDGDLGAGKTCFAQGVGFGLGVVEPVVSPTFTLVAEYDGRMPLLHADVYRLTAAEVPHMGLEEAVEDWPGIALVEWAGRLPDLLPLDHLAVQFAIFDVGRTLAVQAHGPRAAATLAAWRRAWQAEDGGG